MPQTHRQGLTMALPGQGSQADPWVGHVTILAREARCKDGGSGRATGGGGYGKQQQVKFL